MRPLSSHLRDQDRRRARAERALKQSFYAVSTCHFASSVSISISIFLPSISPSCSSRRRMLSNVATFKGEEDQRGESVRCAYQSKLAATLSPETHPLVQLHYTWQTVSFKVFWKCLSILQNAWKTLLYCKVYLEAFWQVQYLRSGMPFTKSIKIFQFKDILP